MCLLTECACMTPAVERRILGHACINHSRHLVDTQNYVLIKVDKTVILLRESLKICGDKNYILRAKTWMVILQLHYGGAQHGCYDNHRETKRNLRRHKKPPYESPSSREDVLVRLPQCRFDGGLASEPRWHETEEQCAENRTPCGNGQCECIGPNR